MMDTEDVPVEELVITASQQHILRLYYDFSLDFSLDSVANIGIRRLRNVWWDFHHQLQTL